MAAGETPLSDVRFLTVAEVASIMRVSKMTVYRLVHSGELEADSKAGHSAFSNRRSTGTPASSVAAS